MLVGGIKLAILRDVVPSHQFRSVLPTSVETGTISVHGVFGLTFVRSELYSGAFGCPRWHLCLRFQGFGASALLSFPGSARLGPFALPFSNQSLVLLSGLSAVALGSLGSHRYPLGCSGQGWSVARVGVVTLGLHKGNRGGLQKVRD